MSLYNFQDKIKDVATNLDTCQIISSEIRDEQDEINNQLKEQEASLNRLLQIMNGQPVAKAKVDDVESINLQLFETFPANGSRRAVDHGHNLSAIDILIPTLIGGLAVLVDFLLVKIPKDTNYLHEFKQDGSPLTDWLKSLGSDSSGKTSAWVTELENKFKVPYDKSVNNPSMPIPGFGPKTHRLLSLGHDPFFGVVFAVFDIMRGTCTTIGKDGIIRIEQITEGLPLEEILYAPIIWFGHILSDVTTKMGIPIPGWSALQALQFGSLGEKQRTIADIARYMYLEGYDMRHLATMAVAPAVIGLFVRLYFYFFAKKNSDNLLLSEREYTTIKNDIKLHKMLFIASSVASAGNIAKVAAHQGNPLSINLPIWLGMAKEAIAMTKIALRDSKKFEEAIENRHQIDDNWDYLKSLTQ